jgi:uridine monophosphate synthetase
MNQHLSYSQRIELTSVPVAKKLLSYIEEKKTNLALAADVTSASELIHLANLLGPYICILKTHIDIITDFTPALTTTLRELAIKYQFLIFEDRKFADIGHTAKLQYQSGMYRIVEWADIINAHTLPGPGIITGLAEAGMPKDRGLLLLANMSSAGHLFQADYIAETLVLANRYRDFVFGFITQHAITTDPRWIYLTPGIQLQTGYDALGQQYVTPEVAITERGCDIQIIGRGIIEASDPVKAAIDYRLAGWDAYQKRLNN